MTQTMRPLQWRVIVLAAAVGTALATLGLLIQIQEPGNGNPLVVIAPGTQGPSVEAFHEDFPGLELPEATGHDGQQFYAIARNPWHLDEVADDLGRPTYRLGRPLLSWLAWGLHPSGGGLGLVRAFLLVELLAVFGFGVAGGALVQHLGGSPRIAAAFPVLPGTIATLSITTADVLAMACLVGGIAAVFRGRFRLGGLLGAMAILAKESVAVPLAVFLLVRMVQRRDRAAPIGRQLRTAARSAEFGVGVVSVVPWLGWSVWIRTQLGAGTHIVEFGLPFQGLVDGWNIAWSHGDHQIGLLVVAATYVVAIGALVGGRSARTPVWWATAAQFGFTTLFGIDVVALDLNGPRTTMPLLVLAIAVLVSDGMADGQAAHAQISAPPPSAPVATP